MRRPPGQVIAHPSYGWLVCVRVAGRTWADNGVSAGSLVGVAARRALPEEIELAQWRTYAGMGDEAESSWLQPEHVGDVVESVAEFTGWPITASLASRPNSSRRTPADSSCSARSRRSMRPSAGSPRNSEERSLYQRGYRWRPLLLGAVPLRRGGPRPPRLGHSRDTHSVRRGQPAGLVAALTARVSWVGCVVRGAACC